MKYCWRDDNTLFLFNLHRIVLGMDVNCPWDLECTAGVGPLLLSPRCYFTCFEALIGLRTTFVPLRDVKFR